MLNHPNIVTIYDFGQAGGFYFLLMGFVNGVNLRQAMKAGRFTPEQALAIVDNVVLDEYEALPTFAGSFAATRRFLIFSSCCESMSVSRRSVCFDHAHPFRRRFQIPA